jgi:hypothetical protein
MDLSTKVKTLARPEKKRYLGGAPSSFSEPCDSVISLSEPRQMDIDLIAIVRTLVRNFRLLLLTAIAGAIVGVIYLNLVTYRYSVTLELAPVQSAAPSATSMLGGLSGLANLAGVNLPADSAAQQRELYVAQLTSALVANDLLADKKIVMHLFQGRWDAQNGRWKTERGLLSSIASSVRSLLGAPGRQLGPPTPADMQQVLENDVSIVNQRGAALISIGYTDADADFARYFLLQLHQAADERMRQRVIDRTTKYIEFVNKELTNVTAAEQRQALIQTLSEQLRSRMFAGAKTAFAVDVFSPPIIENNALTPKPLPTLITMITMGGLLGAAIILALTRLGSRELNIFSWKRSPH